MRDQWIIGRAALGLENLRDRRFIEHICAQAIDCLGRERREPAIFDIGGGFSG